MIYEGHTTYNIDKHCNIPITGNSRLFKKTKPIKLAGD